MNTTQAIAKIRRLHAGHYHEHAKWHVVIDKRCAVRQPDRDAARAKLAAMRAEAAGKLPSTGEVKQLQVIAFSYRVKIGRVEGLGGFGWFTVDGIGDTVADAYADLERRFRLDQERYAKARAETR